MTVGWRRSRPVTLIARISEVAAARVARIAPQPARCLTDTDRRLRLDPDVRLLRSLGVNHRGWTVNLDTTRVLLDAVLFHDDGTCSLMVANPYPRFHWLVGLLRLELDVNVVAFEDNVVVIS